MPLFLKTQKTQPSSLLQQAEIIALSAPPRRHASAPIALPPLTMTWTFSGRQHTRRLSSCSCPSPPPSLCLGSALCYVDTVQSTSHPRSLTTSTTVRTTPARRHNPSPFVVAAEADVGTLTFVLLACLGVHTCPHCPSHDAHLHIIHSLDPPSLPALP